MANQLQHMSLILLHCIHICLCYSQYESVVLTMYDVIYIYTNTQYIQYIPNEIFMLLVFLFLGNYKYSNK